MKLTIREIAIWGMLGAVMYVSKIIMEFIPNVHLLGVFTIAFTVVYKKKALYPIYAYVILNGIFCGFATWWISIRNFICSNAGNPTWIQFSRNDSMDYRRSAVGLYSRHQ